MPEVRELRRDCSAARLDAAVRTGPFGLGGCSNFGNIIDNDIIVIVSIISKLAGRRDGPTIAADWGKRLAVGFAEVGLAGHRAAKHAVAVACAARSVTARSVIASAVDAGRSAGSPAAGAE